MKITLFRWLRWRFDLVHDMATPEAIVAGVEDGITFRGTNLWVLIFAILVASVGLNVNSTAVIIGAMLISPLMGPIVGVGFGAATMEVALIRRGLKNLFVAAGISLLVSALYFWLTPLTDAGSELLARTTPTTWDVLIALFGGAAGAVGLTRRARGNVVPGVAIATALMPPLCTAGYGLATAHWAYLFGALYLFFINCVFISLATFLVARILPLPVHTFVSSRRARQVQLSIWAVALLTAVPSVYLAAGIVRRTTFTHNAQRFVEEQLNLPGSFVVTRRLDADARTINVLLAGQQLTPAQLRQARGRLPEYRLTDARLTVRQGLARLDSADAQSLRSSLLEDVHSRNQQTLAGYDSRLAQLQQVLAAPDSPLSTGLPAAARLLREVQVEHPSVRQLGLSRVVQAAADSLRADTVVVVSVRARRPLPLAEQQRLQQWLSLRAGDKRRVQLLVQ
ncbi:TIGR00341 family protein [Hymenobacter saemangeumensis]|uniref:TIGR00341 family protein n=1 Tax=Hymenobacter saemangeumensis TaxID=1084522 RepID=A0ABP8IHX2_9BACT